MKKKSKSKSYLISENMLYFFIEINMENQMNVGNQNTQKIDQNPVNQSTVLSEKLKMNYLLIGGVVLACFVVFGFGGYYLGKQSSTYQPNLDNTQNQLNPTVTPESNNPTISPTNQLVSTLPSGWSYKDNGECGVEFAIPPKADPYYKPYDPNRQPSVTDDTGSGRFWDFPRGGVYPNLLSKFQNGYEQHKQANTMYAAEQEASGYVSSAVSVSCILNEGNLNNQNMLSTLKTRLQEYNQETGEKGMQADSYTIQTSKETNRWGHTVLDLAVSEYFKNSGGQPFTNSVQYTMFTTPKYIYEIKVFGASENSFVKETATKIFDNFLFQ